MYHWPEMIGRMVDAYGPIDGMNTVQAFVLSAREAADRAAVVDALITVASREELRGADVAPAAVELVVRDEVVLERVVHEVRDAARAGLVQLSWELVAVLIESLPPGDGERPRTGLADLLALGVELADQVPAEVPGVASVAARSGSSRFIKEARRLHQAMSVLGSGRDFFQARPAWRCGSGASDVVWTAGPTSHGCHPTPRLSSPDVSIATRKAHGPGPAETRHRSPGPAAVLAGARERGRGGPHVTPLTRADVR
ncbi:hypothetical protein [Saccharopolyspora pogona]|uniref:hypothetical protein n=1 Tax=Saccharopolyspora pogona TaxID=333966 RepID=UPI001683299D|nr:hypothetical protein [Saccharopolyspora pogona]